jgi:hypothetical protein
VAFVAYRASLDPKAILDGPVHKDRAGRSASAGLKASAEKLAGKGKSVGMEKSAHPARQDVCLRSTK